MAYYYLCQGQLSAASFIIERHLSIHQLYQFNISNRIQFFPLSIKLSYLPLTINVHRKQLLDSMHSSFIGNGDLESFFINVLKKQLARIEHHYYCPLVSVIVNRNITLSLFLEYDYRIYYSNFVLQKQSSLWLA